MRPRQSQQRMPDLDEMLGNDRERLMASVARQPIENGKDRTRRRILDRQNQPVHGTVFESGERGHEARVADSVALGEQLVTARWL